MKLMLFFLIFGIGRLAFSQDLTVSEEILEKLETVVVQTELDTFMFRVAYPDNYSEGKKYSALIGLSGGNQSEEIVNYCYAAWFKSGYFRDYVTILPVNVNKKNFRDYTTEDIERITETIREEFALKDQWILSGTSNGGVAAFNFIAAKPNLFSGVIVAPGIISEEITPSAEWSHLKVILAYGDKDDPTWIKASKESAKKIKKIVNSVKLVPLKNQGHILPISFNVDKMYDPYFLED